VDQLKIANAREKFNAGYISHEQASIEVTGEPPDNPDGPRSVAAPEPEEDDEPPVDEVMDGDEAPERGRAVLPLVHVNGVAT
jgi:hypothetical protein